AQAPCHSMTHDRVADGLGYDETASPLLILGVSEVKHHHTVRKLSASPHRCREIGAAFDSLISRKHGCRGPLARAEPVRRTGWPDPCDDGRTGSHDPRGYASEGGNRGSWHDDGCWAGTSACSLRALLMTVGGPLCGRLRGA